jgi:hypothetical protein
MHINKGNKSKKWRGVKEMRENSSEILLHVISSERIIER